jgi:hypothetical protein
MILSRIDVVGVEIQSERVASRDQPALDRIGQMEVPALAVGQHAIAVMLVPARRVLEEAEPVVERLRGIEVVARQDRGQARLRGIGHGRWLRTIESRQLIRYAYHHAQRRRS